MSWTKIVFINSIVLFCLLFVLEAGVRIFIDFKINYYAAPLLIKNNSVRSHPYGDIPVNSDGFFDGEWEKTKSKERIGYFGDSVTYGVGAGYPYRISEYMDQFTPSHEHVNLSGGLGGDITSNSEEYYAELSNRFKIDKIIYLMNLNDIAPIASAGVTYNETKKNDHSANETENVIQKLKRLMQPVDRIFRGNSSLYTLVRFKLKTILTTKMGYEASGFRSIELRPKENSQLLKIGAKNLASISDKINEKVPFCIILLPYEMQISENAALTYKNLNIVFEDEFILFLTQKLFVEEFSRLSKNKIFWIGTNFPQSNVGEYYVYNMGDKIDFNHPNDKGQKILAAEISERNLCL